MAKKEDKASTASGPSSAHHDKLPPYGDMTQAMFGVQLAIAHVRNGLVDGMNVDRACAVHGAYTALGVGLSFIPHDHPEGAVREGLDLQAAADDETLAAKLEEAVPTPKGGPAGASGIDAIPWDIVIPILLQLLQRWLSR